MTTALLHPRPISRASALTLAFFALSTIALFAGQGVQRMLYTSPNMGFIEQSSGEVVVNVNDTSGLISTLQTEINNARATHTGTGPAQDMPYRSRNPPGPSAPCQCRNPAGHSVPLAASNPPGRSVPLPASNPTRQSAC